MTIKYHDLEQGSPEWHEARRGVLTASTMGKLFTAKHKLADNKACHTIALTLLAERLTGVTDISPTAPALERGHIDEIYARDIYAENVAPVKEVGFITRDFDGVTLGYSPDGLVGHDGAIEIKSRIQAYQMETILLQEVPKQYWAQIQTGLLVANLKWLDFCSYPANGGGKMLVTRVFPDKEFHALILEAALTCEENIAKYKEQYEEALKSKKLKFIDTFRHIEEEIIV